MTQIHTELKNFFHLHAEIVSPGSHFAFYLYFGNTIIERTPYSVKNNHRFILRERGIYTVKGYSRDGARPGVSVMSERISFAGVPSLPPALPKPELVIVGLSKVSAFAGKVLARSFSVRGYVDAAGAMSQSSFFGLPVFDAIPGGTVAVGHENYATLFPNIERFSLSFGAHDVLSNELNRIGAIGLYRISRDAYLDGLIEGAEFLHSFIRIKFSCRVPYTAVIGEGTNLSLAGLGTAIHPDTVIGRDCIIGQNVTLGGRAGKNAAPIIGNNVFIGPGAKCLGGKIGNNVVVGANAVVVSEIPDNCVVAGVPARIISREIENYRSYTHVRHGR